MKDVRLIHRVLMCRGHEACSFSYDLVRRAVVGKVVKREESYVPLGALGADGAVSAPLLSSWVSARAVPLGRENVGPLLAALGLRSTEELMLFGLGLSLSDQYWFRPPGSGLTWDEVKLYGREFGDDVGYALVPHDETSAGRAKARIAARGEVSSSSPDAALNGNLPKFWSCASGSPRLYKTGHASHLMLEPYCEVAATLACASVLPQGAYVPYRLDGLIDGRPLGSCPPFTDEHIEFVPACDVFRLAPRDNSLSRYERYARLLESRGVADARRRLSEMLAIDHVIGNFDRHWGNFGVLVDAETREWVAAAPLFDMGASFDCDRAIGRSRPPRKARYGLPFLTRPDEQMRRYAKDLSWFDSAAVRAAVADALGTVCSAPLLTAYADMYAEVESRQIESAILGVERRAVADRRAFALSCPYFEQRECPEAGSRIEDEGPGL